MSAYVLCGTPRTGSTLLCSLLRSSGVAGRPESYFRAPDEAAWAARWGVDANDTAAFLRAAVAAGSTPNGVFGARLMWGTVEHLTAKLRTVAPGDDRELLERAFGPPLAFVFLTRADTLAQAVSWARAEQTGVWQRGDATAGEPHFDEELIHTLVDTVDEHNTAWRAWFAANGIAPLEVSYERLTGDPVGETHRVLAHLGLTTDRPINAGGTRQADDANAGWIRRYRR